eukprot:6416015-Prymnesium_polylepis.1
MRAPVPVTAVHPDGTRVLPLDCPEVTVTAPRPKGLNPCGRAAPGALSLSLPRGIYRTATRHVFCRRVCNFPGNVPKSQPTTSGGTRAAMRGEPPADAPTAPLPTAWGRVVILLPVPPRTDPQPV